MHDLGRGEAVEIMRTIRANYDQLSPPYRRIADYLLSHSLDAAFMPASRLAAEVGVSETMVLRFAAEIGYGGYSGLAREIQSYVKQALIPSNRLRRTVADDLLSPSALRTEIVAQDAANLLVTATDYVNRAFGTVVQHLVAANQIFVLGLRGMAHLAQLLGYLLEGAGAETTVMTRGDSPFFSHLRWMKEGDALLVFAYRRYTRRTLDAIHFARNRGVIVLTITDALNSPPGILSDVLLRTAVSSPSFVASHSAGVAMSFALAEAYGRAVPAKKSESELLDLLPPTEISLRRSKHDAPL